MFVSRIRIEWVRHSKPNPCWGQGTREFCVTSQRNGLTNCANAPQDSSSKAKDGSRKDHKAPKHGTLKCQARLPTSQDFVHASSAQHNRSLMPTRAPHQALMRSRTCPGGCTTSPSACGVQTRLPNKVLLRIWPHSKDV